MALAHLEDRVEALVSTVVQEPERKPYEALYNLKMESRWKRAEIQLSGLEDVILDASDIEDLSRQRGAVGTWYDLNRWEGRRRSDAYSILVPRKDGQREGVRKIQNICFSFGRPKWV